MNVRGRMWLEEGPGLVRRPHPNPFVDTTLHALLHRREPECRAIVPQGGQLFIRDRTREPHHDSKIEVLIAVKMVIFCHSIIDDFRWGSCDDVPMRDVLFLGREFPCFHVHIPARHGLWSCRHDPMRQRNLQSIGGLVPTSVWQAKVVLDVASSIHWTLGTSSDMCMCHSSTQEDGGDPPSPHVRQAEHRSSLDVRRVVPPATCLLRYDAVCGRIVTMIIYEASLRHVSVSIQIDTNRHPTTNVDRPGAIGPRKGPGGRIAPSVPSGAKANDGPDGRVPGRVSWGFDTMGHVRVMVSQTGTVHGPGESRDLVPSPDWWKRDHVDPRGGPRAWNDPSKRTHVTGVRSKINPRTCGCQSMTKSTYAMANMAVHRWNNGHTAFLTQRGESAETQPQQRRIQSKRWCACKVAQRRNMGEMDGPADAETGGDVHVTLFPRVRKTRTRGTATCMGKKIQLMAWNRHPLHNTSPDADGNTEIEQGC